MSDKSLKPLFCSPFPLHRITVDMAVFNVDRGHVLLGKRKNEPFAGCWSLPGGFFNPEDCKDLGIKADFSLREAAARELQEETGLDLKHTQSNHVHFVGYYDHPKRAPQRTINFAFSCIVTDRWLEKHPPLKAADDLAELEWFPVERIKWFGRGTYANNKIAFDHQRIIEDAWEHYYRLGF